MKKVLLTLITIVTITLIIVGVSICLSKKGHSANPVIDESNNPAIEESSNPKEVGSTHTPNIPSRADMTALVLGVAKNFDLAVGVSAYFVVDNAVNSIGSYADYEISITADEALKLKINGEENIGTDNRFYIKSLEGVFDIEIYGQQTSMTDIEIMVDIPVQMQDINIPAGHARIVAIASDKYDILPLQIVSEELIPIESYIIENDDLVRLKPYSFFNAWNKDNRYSLGLIPGKTYICLRGSNDRSLEVDLIIGEQPLSLNLDEINEVEISPVRMFYKIELDELTNLRIKVSYLDEQEMGGYIISVIDAEFNDLESMMTDNSRWVYGLENYCWIGLDYFDGSGTVHSQVSVNKIDAPCEWYVDKQLVKNNITLETGKTYELQQKFTKGEESVASFRIDLSRYNRDDIFDLEGNMLTIKEIDLAGAEPLLIITGYYPNGQMCMYVLYVKIKNKC